MVIKSNGRDTLIKEINRLFNGILSAVEVM
jgi:hypothetical protein